MNRTANYTTFYVNEPFDECNLGANATADFIYYNLLKAWKSKDNSFPFVNAHDKTYNVRDDSDWEATLKPRLHQRINGSKNLILFLSSITTYSRALNEEIKYAIDSGLPIIVIYPDFVNRTDIVGSNNRFKQQITELWDNLPRFRDRMNEVPVFHIPLSKTDIEIALNDPDFMYNTKTESGNYFLKSN